MAKTANDVVKEIFGDIMFEIVKLRTENEQLKEEIEQLKKEQTDGRK